MKKLIIFSVILTGFFISCNKNDFADINQNPTQVNNPDMAYLFTQALYKLDDTYTEWFYDNAQYALPWTQTTVSSSGNTGDVIQDKEHGNRISLFYKEIFANMAEIRECIDHRFDAKEQMTYQHIKYMTYPLQIMQALKITDMYGSMAYLEAGQARYTNPPLLKPSFENQETLLKTWDQELKKSIEVLLSSPTYNNEPINQIPLGSQDFIYRGKVASWAKFANSLRLRIAARLINVNKTLAKQIAEEVATSQAGVMSSLEDDFYWSPSPEYYHFQNDIWFGVGGKNLIDFLRNNQDPRLRFIFSKNDYNSKVIQGFFEYNALAKANAKKFIPDYIYSLVNSHIETQTFKINNNKKDTVVDVEIFDSWKAPGEPWVRYFGAPTAPDAKQDPTINKEYFITENFKLGNKSYSPTSFYNEKNIVSNKDEVYPDIPSITLEHKEDARYHSLLFSSAEIQLYLAEFKLLGANISGNANDYFQKAITLSVQALDKLARDNDILYYKEAYDKAFESTIELGPSEIESLLSKDGYKLTGDLASDLEKVYIQQYINFLNLPNELFVNVRRTGVPKTGSTLLPREPFTDGGAELIVPRRFTATTPTPDDINYENKLKAIQDQGFTAGSSDPHTLHDQRLWYDKTAPDWGKGPVQ